MYYNYNIYVVLSKFPMNQVDEPWAADAEGEGGSPSSDIGGDDQEPGQPAAKKRRKRGGSEDEDDAPPLDNPFGGPKPGTKQEMDSLRARFSNTLRLVAHLYHDRSLQEDMRMVSCATLPYMREYSAALAMQKESQDRVHSNSCHFTVSFLDRAFLISLARPVLTGGINELPGCAGNWP